MVTKAISADGTTLLVNSNTIGEIQSVSGSRTRNVIDILTCDSTNQAVEIIAGSLNEGEVTFQLVYDGSAAGVYDKLNTDLQAGTLATATITYKDGSIHSGSAIITNLDVPSFGGVDENVTVSLTLRCSGKWTYTDVA